MSEIEQGSDGFYALCIHGVDEVSDDELREIFGKFREIESFRRNKNNNNLAFIGYSTLEEATQCQKDMRNHEKLKVNPARRKPQGENTDSSRNKGRNNDGDGFKGRDRDNDGSKGRNRDSDGFKGRDSGGFKGRDSDGFKGRDSDGFKSRDGDGFKSRNGDGFKGRDGGEGSQWGKERGDASRSKDSGPRGSLPPKPPLTFDPPPAEIPEGTEKKVAKAVIIGHIHPLMNKCNIYELSKMASVQPLHVAMKKINRPPNPVIHYAYVYVREEDDVQRLCEGLDNLKVNNYQMIVKSAEQLEEEGAALKKKE